MNQYEKNRLEALQAEAEVFIRRIYNPKVTIDIIDALLELMEYDSKFVALVIFSITKPISGKNSVFAQSLTAIIHDVLISVNQGTEDKMRADYQSISDGMADMIKKLRDEENI